MTSKNLIKKPVSVYHDGAIYQPVETSLCTTYTKLQDIKEVEELTPTWNGKKIPIALWKEILAFMKHSYDVLSSETLVYLFYDENKQQPWSYWVPPQETAGMTVKSLPDHPDYIEQRALYPDTMFGTVHHHCSTSAFQSGTDEADEVNREGMHFTVGKLNNTEIVDVHFRITLGGAHAELDAQTYIKMEESPFKRTCRVPEKIQNQARQELHKLDITTLPDTKHYNFTKHMDNVSKKTFTPVTYNYNQRSLGWDFDSAPEKKIDDEGLLDDTQILAETFIDSVLTDWHFEEILQSYYQYTNNSVKVTDLMHAQLDEEDVRVDLVTMFNDIKYTNSQNYAETHTSIQMFLEEQSNLGVAYTTKELINGLNTIKYDQGTGVQQMDKENVL